jgi:hypothetical protein
MAHLILAMNLSLDGYLDRPCQRLLRLVGIEQPTAIDVMRRVV